jgi:hypothetical protein
MTPLDISSSAVKITGRLKQQLKEAVKELNQIGNKKKVIYRINDAERIDESRHAPVPVNWVPVRLVPIDSVNCGCSLRLRGCGCIIFAPHNLN